MLSVYSSLCSEEAVGVFQDGHLRRANTRDGLSFPRIGRRAGWADLTTPQSVPRCNVIK